MASNDHNGSTSKADGDAEKAKVSVEQVDEGALQMQVPDAVTADDRFPIPEKALVGTDDDSALTGNGNPKGLIPGLAEKQDPEVGRTPEPAQGAGFAHIDGDLPGQGSGLNDTLVDVIAVPCPGADPVRTWICDPLPDDYFGFSTKHDGRRLPIVEMLAGGALESPAIDQHLPKAAQAWVKQGIRLSRDTARVMLYRHGTMSERTTLEGLAKDLLDQVLQSRQGTRLSRPIFFIAHSIGGLIVKLAILRASQVPQYRQIMYNCHGITFFATPHRGSSYLSMRSLRESIRKLLHLRRPLPRSLANELRINNEPLIAMHNEFLGISSELRIWTFYETMDSPLSGGSGPGTNNEVQFGAPLVSIKSALLDVRQEDVFSVDSDHGNIASFGPANTGTMHTYIKDLSRAIAHAEEISEYTHTPLKLKEHVKVELVGFYDDPAAEMESMIRLYSTKYHLSDFLAKGPERCLEERLNQVPKRPGSSHPPRLQQSESGGEESTNNNGLGIWSNMQKIWTPSGRPSQIPVQPGSPNIVVTKARPPPSVHGKSNQAPNLSTPQFNPLGFESSHGGLRTMSEPPAPYGGGTEFKEAVLTRMQRARLLTKASAMQDLTAGFSRPNPALRKFTWIHVPYTNPVWVKDVFNTLSRTHNIDFSRLFDKENWQSKHNQGSQSQAQPAFVTPSCDYIPATPSPSPRITPTLSPHIPADPTANCFYLFLPYLHFDTYCNIVRRRRVITDRMKHGRASPVPSKVAEMTESLESRIIWRYLGYDPPMNWRRTLDQFGYPSLADTNARDDDQMLYKLTKQDPVSVRQKRGWVPARRSFSSKVSLQRESDSDSSDDDSEAEEETYLRDGNLLMVDQLWLWAIDTTTLTTFFSKRESNPKEGTLFQQADLRNSVYNELNGDLTGRTENALDLAAFVALHAVTVFLDKASHPDLDIFPIFEEAIGLLAERMTSNMKEFRTQSFGSLTDDEGSITSIKKRHKRQLEAAERENRENTSALLELRDMEDELGTLQKLFKTQKQVIQDMKRIYERDEIRYLTVNGPGYLEEALKALKGYQQQATDMEKRVETTRKDYEKMLEMAQRQAQVDEVRWSRLQTELASSQNLSVMIFTTFTVIFLPASFFTSLFGMNTVEWQADTPSLHDIGSIALPTSIALIIISLLAAFSSRVQRACKLVYKNTKEGLRMGKRYAGRLEPPPLKKRKSKRLRRKEEERVKRVKDRQKDRSFDLWAVLKKQGTMEYQIPEMNRKRRDGTGEER
ncbi:hypothetical protein B0H66DRAFT_604635 [Apodospora peruviana]|uniref:DUF676 domain-containing protein n=1 Tax=Apodospora peruviana TaxID=516989 RepID=A0AAE0M3A0_9PEZI|nr:hypothetical protein B0H66DRAFT_604635 [Apodospora peruviana]